MAAPTITATSTTMDAATTTTPLARSAPIMTTKLSGPSPFSQAGWEKTASVSAMAHPPSPPSSSSSSTTCCVIQTITAISPTPAWSQHSLAVTLNALALTVVSLGLLVLLQFGNLTLVKAAIAALPAVLYLHNDYRNFLNLGPGGTPSTPAGYLWLSWVGCLKLSRRQCLTGAPSPPPGLAPATGLFARRGGARLPVRAGPRPGTAGLAPQRQIDQVGSEAHYQAVGRALQALRDRAPDRFTLAKSTLERYGLALYARNPVNMGTRGEICHVHQSDHAFHMALHPDDIREVLETHWGERHPLATVTRLATMPVPPYFTLIYAPQNDEQFQIVLKIIEAAIWFTSGEDVTLVDGKTQI